MIHKLGKSNRGFDKMSRSGIFVFSMFIFLFIFSRTVAGRGHIIIRNIMLSLSLLCTQLFKMVYMNNFCL